MAKLIFNYSSMNSGKTMDLIRTAYNYEENGLKVLVMKPMIDTKGDKNIVTRAGLEKNVDILINSNDNICDLLINNIDNTSCVFIDEAQFLTKNQVDELFICSKKLNIPIICYGLRTNFKGELFEGSSRLLALADELNEFKTLCKCGNIARFNARMVNSIYTTDGENILIDGVSSDIKYVPLCGNCFIENGLIKAETINKILKKVLVIKPNNE